MGTYMYSRDFPIAPCILADNRHIGIRIFLKIGILLILYEYCQERIGDSISNISNIKPIYV